MKTFISCLVLISALLLTSGCTSTKLIQQYKNPETPTYEGNKVLVVGISSDPEVRRTYEKEMTEALEKKDVIAVKSIDFFEESFTDNEKSIEELDSIEDQLLDSGFDTILFTKVTGQESRMTLVDSYREFSRTYQSFRDYYYSNQHLYFKEFKERYQVYTTETSVYCICPGKERELLWRGEIEVVDADKLKRNIKGYMSVLFKTLEDNNILISELK